MIVRVVLFILLMKENLQLHASGYDAYSSCYRKSRKRQDLPCDFGKQTWCSIPGNSYPWHAVRRFVHENQGLMRRMYGDERHLSVLKAEIESNDIELFDDPRSKDEFRRRYRKEMDGARGFVKMLMDAERRDGWKPTKTQKSIDEKSNNVLYHNHFKNPKEPPFNKTLVRPLTTSEHTPTATAANEQSRANMTTAPNETTSPQLISTVMDITTQSESGSKATDWNYTTITDEEVEEEMDYSAETEDIMTTTGMETLTTTNEIDFQDEEGKIDNDEGYSDVTDDEELEEDEEEEPVQEQEAAEEPVSQKSPPVLRLKGINACPVKEEVVAPFWANNTRGEVLALLNLYPFEQYVHWEKCTYEHKQMFCREGCKCEQQYRLHRLLAYDPNNECRGIFSDWFRFPSCCVCKCYDIPMEFRLTSRSPRFRQSQRAELSP